VAEHHVEVPTLAVVEERVVRVDISDRPEQLLVGDYLARRLVWNRVAGRSAVCLADWLSARLAGS